MSLSESFGKPNFEKEIICPKCGQLSLNEVFLTELGQSQLTEATLDFDVDDLFDAEDDELNGFGFYEGECQGCDLFTRLDDLGLCEVTGAETEGERVRFLQDHHLFVLYAAIGHGSHIKQGVSISAYGL